MDATTFTHPIIAKILNEKYYAVKFNAETKDTIYFADRQFVNDGKGRRSPHQLAVALLQGKISYPSIAYLNEDNQLLTTVPGYQTVVDLKPILMFFAEDAFLSQTFEEFQKEFKNRGNTN
jgi:thioredoxin-related protein